MKNIEPTKYVMPTVAASVAFASEGMPQREHDAQPRTGRDPPPRRWGDTSVRRKADTLGPNGLAATPRTQFERAVGESFLALRVTNGRPIVALQDPGRGTRTMRGSPA